VTEQELLKHLETALENKHPKFNWTQLIPETRFGKAVVLVALLMFGGASVKDAVMVGRGILGLPTAIVETTPVNSIVKVKDNLESHMVNSDRRFDRIENNHYDLEKKTEVEILDLRGITSEHTTQINTILSFSSVFPSP